MAVAAVALAAAAQEPVAVENARPRPPRPMTMGPRSMGPMGAADPLLRVALSPMYAEKLGLSEEQKGKIKAITDDNSSLSALQGRVRKGTQRQSELLKADTVDEAAVMATVDEIFEARKEIAKLQTRRMIAVKAILTPEQVKTAKELMMSGRQKRMPRPVADKPAADKPVAVKPEK